MTALNRTQHVAEAFPNATALQGKYALDAGRDYDDRTFALAVSQLAAAYTSLDLPALRATLANLSRPSAPCALERARAESRNLEEERAARLHREAAVTSSLADLDPDEELGLYYACKAAGKVNPRSADLVEVKGRRPRDVWSVAQALADYLARNGREAPVALRTVTGPEVRPEPSAALADAGAPAASLIYAPEALPWE
jgi:hypothetical protein